jgi:hypothetical protein
LAIAKGMVQAWVGIMAEERKEKEKDRTKKIHPAILSMLKQAAATDPHDNNSDIAPSCLRFVNSFFL